jgi:hypothetical protein
MAVSECRLIEFPKIHDPRGNLTFLEGERHIPYDIKRIYYLYDVPGGATRAGHAHKELQQVLIAIAGSFDVHVDDGITKKKFHLNRSYLGLYVPPLTWRVLDNFSSSAVCLSVVSMVYDEGDYYRNYQEFLTAIGVDK